MADTFDAIVVGSGISGGWAAKELSQKGLKTILLERGRSVEHIKDYPTALMHPWQFDHALLNSYEDRKRNPIQSTVYDSGNKHFFVDDAEHPYVQLDPFHWIRGYQLGGRSLTWGRQTYRLSDLDFEANAKEGIAVDWPIRYKDLEFWYSYVERYIGVAGKREGLAQLPDGIFLPPVSLNRFELSFKGDFERIFPGRVVTNARLANLTQNLAGRGPCQYRNLCSRGCPYGGYFSSNSSTIPDGLASGNLTIRPHSIVSEVVYDERTARAKGVIVIDSITKQRLEYNSKVIFLNASTIATAAILLNSIGPDRVRGMGNSSDQLGRNLMDHHFRVGAQGTSEKMKEEYYKGRRPGGMYIPRYRNIGEKGKSPNYVRGFGIQGYSEREFWSDMADNLPGFGSDYKEKILTPGPWKMWLGGWGETLPHKDNRVRLSDEKRDMWGLPQVEISYQWRENEIKMRKDMEDSIGEILDETGFDNVDTFDYQPIGGDCVHEMGTARMGQDPKTSVLNRWNQLHDVKNVFITDGSCMTSSACQNPSLTYMALTARAVDFAVRQLKKGEL